MSNAGTRRFKRAAPSGEGRVNSKSGLGQALDFDGDDDHVNVGNAGSGIQTIGFWIYAHDTTTRDIIDLDGTDQIQLNGSSQIVATDFPAATIYVDGEAGSTVTPNTWHHVLITDTAGVNATALEIGRVTTSNEFDGVIDDVRIYNRALTTNEVNRLYNITHVVISKTRTIINDGLVGHWTFDGEDMYGTTALDKSGQGNHGTLTNGPQPTDGKLGQALEFDGVDSNIDMGDPADGSLDFGTGSFSVIAWIKASTAHTAGVEETILQKRSDLGGGAAGWYFNLNNSTGALRLKNIRDGTNQVINTALSNTVVRDGIWHNIAIIIDRDAGVAYSYVDGVKEAINVDISAVTGSVSNNSNFRIGASNLVPLNQTWAFNGIIDDVRLYDRVLSEHEIKRIYNGTKPSHMSVTTSAGSLADGLAGHWSFDGDVTGPTWTDDVSGNGNSGTLTNGPQATGGKIGQAMEFDGEDAYVAVGNAGSGIQTISFWVHAHDTTTRDIIDLDGTDQIQLNGSSQITATDFPAATIYVDGQIGNSVTPNTWHHVLITDTTGVNATALEIGRVTTSNEFDGILDDVRLYNRVLNPHEIQRLSVMGGR